MRADTITNSKTLSRIFRKLGLSLSPEINAGVA